MGFSLIRFEVTIPKWGAQLCIQRLCKFERGTKFTFFFMMSTCFRIGVQTDCSTPALARFGTEELKETFLKPALFGDMVTCIGIEFI